MQKKEGIPMSKKPPQKGNGDEYVFEGFEPANTTPVPDILFDRLLARLSSSELRVLLYIIRRTWGFKKDTDAISLNQFQYGITTKDGKVLDEGCGIKDRKTIITTLTSLEKKGYIQREKSKTESGDDATTIYRIHFNKVVGKSNHLEQEGSGKIQPPVVGKSTLPRSGKIQPPVVGKSNPQETVLQQTVLQETVIQKSSVSSKTTTQPFVASATATHSFSSQSGLSSEEETKPQEKVPSKKKEKKTEPTEPKGPPVMPPADMEWGTTKCKMMFDAWRGHTLIAQYKIMEASKCAKGLAEQFTEEEVRRVYQAMSEDTYWKERGGPDICNVANNIDKELKKMKSGKVTKQTSSHGTASHDGYTKEERLALYKMTQEERKMYNQKRREARERAMEVQ